MARLNSGPQPSESPMDFSYDDGRGPVSADSPFLQSTTGHLPYKDSFAGQKRKSTSQMHVSQPKVLTMLMLQDLQVSLILRSSQSSQHCVSLRVKHTCFPQHRPQSSHHNSALHHSPRLTDKSTPISLLLANWSHHRSMPTLRTRLTLLHAWERQAAKAHWLISRARSQDRNHQLESSLVG